MRHTLHAVLLLLLLLCLAGCAVASTQRCIFDKLQRANPPVRLPAAPMVRAQEDEWKPIRIVFSAWDLMDDKKYCVFPEEMRPDFNGNYVVCTKEDVLTPEKKGILFKDIFPQAVLRHEERLSIQRESLPLVVPQSLTGVCSLFTIPADHHTSGVRDADIVIYVAAGPTERGVNAWAVQCLQLYNYRPVVGAMNIGPRSVSLSENTVRVVAHEMAHALGFHTVTMRKLGMMTEIDNVRGKPGRLNVLISSNVVEAARRHYACDTISFVELEDEGGSNTAGSHWKRRNAKDELMAGSATAGYYTELTLAAFADMKFYKVDFSKAEPMLWGRNSGCELLEEKCMDNNHTKYSDMFCNKSQGVLQCTSDRQGLGKCSIKKYNEDLPEYFQYFDDKRVGGKDNYLMDRCPAIERFSYTRCTDGNPNKMPGSIISRSSRCVKVKSNKCHPSPVNDVCVKVLCEAGKVKIKYSENTPWQKCEPGKMIRPRPNNIKGSIVCPLYEEVCTAMGIDNVP